MNTCTSAPPGHDETRWEPVREATPSSDASQHADAGRRPTRRLSDEQGEALLRRFAAGECDALDRLIEAYSATVYAILLRWYRLSVEDAEDLFQEVLLQLTVKAAEIRNPRRWLVGTAINQARKRIRGLIRDRKLADRYGEELLLQEAPEPEDERDLVHRGLAHLRTFDRDLLGLLYFEGLSYEEAAERLERPIGSIGPLRGRALKRLGDALEALEATPQLAT
jgi:RNA polymerase sigma factor (sigma-70 family)